MTGRVPLRSETIRSSNGSAPGRQPISMLDRNTLDQPARRTLVTRVNRSWFLMASTLPSPALADTGYMGVPTDLGIGGFVLGCLLIIVGGALIGGVYGFLSYIVERLRARK